MIPVVFVNCSSVPYVDMILSGKKVFETRSRNTLKSLVGRRVLIAETGKGSPVIRCSARITTAFTLENSFAWNMFRDYTAVPEGTTHDWKEGTKVKWLYELSSVRPVSVPFVLPSDSIRHGRVWAEYTHKKVL